MPRTADEHLLKSSTSSYSRTAWFAAGPPHTPHMLALFFDGEHYLRDVDALAQIDALVEDGRLPPMSCLFISNGSSEARHDELTCSDTFMRFVVDDALPWARQRVPAIRQRAHLVAGLSLGGLMSAYVAVNNPELFTRALCQSGSFWYRHQWFGSLVRERAPQPARFWLSVGDGETDVDVHHPPTGLHQQITQIAGVEHAVAALEDAGAAVRYNLFSGGHTFDPWREELPTALTWLLRGAEREASTREA